jgi:FAD/FMN-containing dehydrogenase
MPPGPSVIERNRNVDREGDSQLLARIAAIVGERNLVTDPEVRSTYESDWTGRWSGEALAVVRPGSTAEVRKVILVCEGTPVALVTQGGNTGLVAGSIPGPDRPSVVLSTTRLDHLGDPDPSTGQIRVGAGVALAALQARARAHGWDAGLDLGARDSATIGGLVACNAGGMRAIRYGTARARVGGLEAVLAGGVLVDRMNGLPKDNAGLDLPSLLIGSEGILGVITEVVWRLVRAPGEQTAALVPLDSTETAVELTGLLRERVRTLEAVELMTREVVELSLAYLGASAPIELAPVCLLVECEADDASLTGLSEALQQVGAADSAALAVDPGGRGRLRQIREGAVEAIAADGVSHKFDIGVPLANLPRFVEVLAPLVESIAPGSRLLYFGHLGDGNLHVNVFGPSPDDEEIDAAVLALVADCGGTISAEHGVGKHKAKFLSLVRSSAEIEAMWAIKRALDPHLLLNPGAVLEIG